jgi:hypothetical protein
MTTKLSDKNRRVHMAKVLAQSNPNKKRTEALSGQYEIIRKDALRLREDLAHGYELLKEWIETVISRRTFFKSK